MKNKLTIVIAIVGLMLAFAVGARAQDPQQSIEQQIKQKEAELERLKEIKKRQDQIRQLQDEIRRLQGGEAVPNNEAPQSPKPEPQAAATPVPQLDNQPIVPADPAENRLAAPAQPAIMAARSLSTSAASSSDLPTLRDCTTVKSLSDAAVRAHAPDPTSLIERYVCRTVNKVKDRKVGNPRMHLVANPSAGLNLREDFYPLMIALLAREGRAQYVIDAENEKVDTQVGSDASSGGSTSLVTKGSVPSILGFAVDNGGLLRSSDGSTITFRGNVAGLAKAVAGKGFISGYDEDSPAARFLRRTAFSFSFDTSRGDFPGTFTGSKQQISNYSVHLDLYNKRDPRLPRYREDWKAFLSGVSEAFVSQIGKSFDVLADSTTNTWNDPALKSWYVVTNAAIQSAPPQDVEAILLDALTKAPTDLADTTVTELRGFDQHFKAWLDEREAILDKIAKAPIISFDYTNDRPLNAGTLSKFNLIGELGFGSRLDLTFNGALTLFNKKPTTPGIGRVRDFQFATQLDVPFGEVGLGLGKPVLSFAGRYERLVADATTAAGTTLPNTRGDIGVGQIKLVIPIKNSGVRIPLSFSFANRTELIKEKEVRGNFGFTFDLDTIFAKFKPFSRN
jgi:hypothetical protein